MKTWARWSWCHVLKLVRGLLGMLTGLPPHSAGFLTCSEVWKGKTSILTLNQSTSSWFCFRQSLRLQLSPRTSLVTFIWSVFSSNLPTILQRWNKSQMFMWQAKKICSVVFFLGFPRMECKIKSNFKIEDSLDNNIWKRIKLKWQSSTLFPTSKNQSLR